MSQVANCPACEYPWVGEAVQVCPECGYQLLEEDRLLNERRTIFLELTKLPAAGWIAGLVLLSLLGYGVPLIGLGLGMAGGYALVANRPRLHQRLIMRVWLLNLVWAVLPWIAGALGVRTVVWLEELYYYGYPSGGERLRSIMVALSFFIVISFASLVMWNWRWRRLVVMAGLPSAIQEDARTRVVRKFVIGPIIAAAALGAVGMIAPLLMMMMDWLFPGWDMRP